MKTKGTTMNPLLPLLAALLLVPLAVLYAAEPATPPKGDDWFLLTSHVNDREGLHLAVSPDGVKWQVVNGDRPVFARTVGDVFRDPSIARDESGTYHLVWTIAWGCRKHKGVGYATSTDLIAWSQQRVIPVMENEPKAEFVWAPELFWDAKERQWMIHWASSVTGKFPETLALYNGRANGRIYYTLTKDFQTFTPSRLLFNANCLAIDSYLYGADDGQYYVFFKADRQEAPKRGILVAKAPAATGPYTLDPQMLTAPDEGWAEGPSVIKVGDKHRMYYSMRSFRAYESPDLKSWTRIREAWTPPRGYRHGTVIRISPGEARRLLEHKFPDWSIPK
jgi:beta-xylosidase